MKTFDMDAAFPETDTVLETGRKQRPTSSRPSWKTGRAGADSIWKNNMPEDGNRGTDHRGGDERHVENASGTRPTTAPAKQRPKTAPRWRSSEMMYNPLEKGTSKVMQRKSHSHIIPGKTQEQEQQQRTRPKTSGGLPSNSRARASSTEKASRASASRRKIKALASRFDEMNKELHAFEDDRLEAVDFARLREDVKKSHGIWKREHDKIGNRSSGVKLPVPGSAGVKLPVPGTSEYSSDESEKSLETDNLVRDKLTEHIRRAMQPQNEDQDQKWKREAAHVEINLLNQMNRDFADELGSLQCCMKGVQLSKIGSSKILDELNLKLKHLTRQHALNGKTIGTTQGLLGKNHSTTLNDSVRHATMKHTQLGSQLTVAKITMDAMHQVLSDMFSVGS